MVVKLPDQIIIILTIVIYNNSKEAEKKNKFLIWKF